MTKLSLAGVVVAPALCLLLALDCQHLRKENRTLRAEIQRLQKDSADLIRRSIHTRPAPQLPAPHLQLPAPPANSQPEESQSTKLYDRLLNGKEIRLSVDQLQDYLKASRRSAASLLAAYRATGDPTLLQEALRNFPNDPKTDFVGALNKSAPPEERRQWLDAFKKSAPDNALANYLSAVDYFNVGQNDQAVQELIAASGKPFQDYSLDFVQNAEDAYLAAGYSAADAKTISIHGLLLPQAAELKNLGLDMVNLANSYRQAGDETSAQAALQMAVNLALSYGSSPFMINQLVATKVESVALGALNPASPYGDTGMTVLDRLNQIAQQRATFTELAHQTNPIMPTMSDQDWISYSDRMLLFGEAAAMRWLVDKSGKP